MRIIRTYAVPGQGAYYCEDLPTLHAHPTPVEERWRLPAASAGLTYAREVGEAVSIGIELEDRSVHWGDGVGVAYAGKAGRPPVLRAAEATARWQEAGAPLLVGEELPPFRVGCEELMPRLESVLPPSCAHPMTYALSQALLAADAHATSRTMAEVVSRSWGLLTPMKVPLHGQCGLNLYHGADALIVRGVASLPHALVDDPLAQLGEDGRKPIAYLEWLVERIGALGPAGYQPTLHLDVHGGLGVVLGGDLALVAERIVEFEAAAQPYPLRIESAVVAATRDAQIEAMVELCQRLGDLGSRVTVVVDEWANTRVDIEEFASAGAGHMIQVKTPDLGSLHHSIEAARTVMQAGRQVLLGGSCNETEISARAALHVAMALQPAAYLLRPGMGIDEACSAAVNEMGRVEALLGG